MEKFILVGLGGAAGAMARYAVSLIPSRTAFPLPTLLTNFGGALLIGLVVGFAAGHGYQGKWLLFWKTGVCGGFTTFSTFSLEAWELFEHGRAGLGGLYVVLSVLLCVLGVALGRWLGCRI